MKTLLFSAVALCAFAGIAPALADPAPAPQQAQAPHHEMKAMTRSGMMQMVQDHFAKLDADKDGFVTKAELDAGQTAMHERMAEHMSGKHMAMARMHGGMAGHMFAAADANNDGRVSLQEATAAAAAHFDKLDANHDGIVTSDEMRAAHKAMRGAAGRR